MCREEGWDVLNIDGELVRMFRMEVARSLHDLTLGNPGEFTV